MAGCVSTPGLRGPDAVCSHVLLFLGSGPPVPAPDLLMQIKQEGELQLQEQQALGVEAWAAGQPDIGEEPWGLSQLDSGAGDVSTDAAPGEWLGRGAASRDGDEQLGLEQRPGEEGVPRLLSWYFSASRAAFALLFLPPASGM